ncbi:hypothetical protein [Janibacter sp. GS2]
MRPLDALHSSDNDVVIAKTIGLVLSGALILAWAALKLLPAQIGA